MKTIETITVNQWHIKKNAEEGTDLPAICINVYEYCPENTFGKKLSGPDHVHIYSPKWDFTDQLDVVQNSKQKTPCGASCWVQIIRRQA